MHVAFVYIYVKCCLLDIFHQLVVISGRGNYKSYRAKCFYDDFRLFSRIEGRRGFWDPWENPRKGLVVVSTTASVAHHSKLAVVTPR